MDSAKAAKAEKDRAAFELADLESKLPKPAAKKGATSTPPAEKAGAVKTLDLGRGIKMEFVLIPAGSFMMGSKKVKGGDLAIPVHKATIAKPFYMGKYEVTQEQWEQVMGSNPSGCKGSKNPVTHVNWNDCHDFLSQLEDKVKGLEVRLPTEAEWEYACRAGSKTEFCYGDDESKLGQYGWFSGNSGNTTHPVGEKKPNAWGLYDMYGNVWEWCSDWVGLYGGEPETDPVGSSYGEKRVHRGGSFEYDAEICRSASRSGNILGLRHPGLGLRVVLVPR